ncbi:hypothetical protein [Pseudonocardia sp. H11422]|uniref:hypothetical protein n=1 Tax=Pseudonocardia sp. H11422 TaxID=2835866 RepID=UPI001BDBE050|nr:hypothetical protein [Pseudonocardia sp. H11422]
MAEIVLHRPDELNAMNMAWADDLLDVVTAVADDPRRLLARDAWTRGSGAAWARRRE